MPEQLRLRRYESSDADAVRELHERAMIDSGTDPSDIPGTDDLRQIEDAYLGTGGEFLVGLLPAAGGAPPEVSDDPALAVEDGALVAMGGFLPAEAGHEDERSVPGAAELHRMRVAPACQRRGYASRLLDELETRAREAGFERLLATTARRQRAAVNFYPVEGYVETDTSTYESYELVHFEKQL